MTDNSVERPQGDLYAVMARARAGREPLRLRDRHKIDKLERIAAAAQARFARDGYEGATLRDIARDAGVALGTLALYASDKRDLIMLIFNRLIPPMLDEGLRNVGEDDGLADAMTAFFEPFYRTFADDVTLYRIVLGQIYGGRMSVHANENGIIRSALIDNLTALLSRAVAAGECNPAIDLGVQARSFYYLYFAAVRVWLSRDAPLPEAGIAELRLLFHGHVEGLRRRRR